MLGRLLRRPRHTGRVLLGILLALALHLLQVPLGWVIRPAFAYLGATQWLYLLPAIWVAEQYANDDVAWGMVLGGALTMLVNAVGYGIMYYLFFVPHS